MNKVPRYTTDEERYLIARLTDAMKNLNEAAHDLTTRGMDVRLFGWTSPGMTGDIRVQGNSSFTVERSERYVEESED